MAVGLHGKHDTGTDRLPIEQNGTGPTNPVLAANVGAGQAQFVAQKVAQQQARFDAAFILCSVDG
jgi:hypothetical protein